MDDLEITKLCAEAMDIRTDGIMPNAIIYDPLHDDAQAMALVKRFLPIMTPDVCPSEWRIEIKESAGRNADFNRAICLCVANMQAAK